MGAVQEDSSGYPDCRESFFKAFSTVIEEGTKPDTSIEIVTPLIHLSKKEIVEMGVALKVPFHLTWSCYKEKEIACGHCDSCLLRLRGFQQAELPRSNTLQGFHPDFSRMKAVFRCCKSFLVTWMGPC